MKCSRPRFRVLGTACVLWWFASAALAAAPVAKAAREATVSRPTLESTGPRSANTPTKVYKKFADGDWRMADGTKASFNFANGGRDLIINPGDRLVFKGVKFDGQVNVGPIWNFDNGNTKETEVLIEDCMFSEGLCVNTVGRMKVTIRYTRTNGYTGPSPDSLIPSIMFPLSRRMAAMRPESADRATKASIPMAKTRELPS